MTNLFIPGTYTGTSGKELHGKIECDALTRDDYEWFAAEIVRIIGPFRAVEGVPTGGLPLADALTPYIHQGWDNEWMPLLIVDDVWTTGKTMNEYRDEREAIGAVMFARYAVDPWVEAVFYSHNAIEPR